VCFPNRTYIRKTSVSLCVIVIVDMRKVTAGYVPQKWQVARTSDLASRWHSSSDSSEFRVTGVSLTFELPVLCAAIMIWQRVRFDSDPIIRWLRRSLNDIRICSKHCTHYENVNFFFTVCKIVTYNNCLLYKNFFLVIHLSTLI
jgi:hypothetical protein